MRIPLPPQATETSNPNEYAGRKPIRIPGVPTIPFGAVFGIVAGTFLLCCFLGWVAFKIATKRRQKKLQREAKEEAEKHQAESETASAAAAAEAALRPASLNSWSPPSVSLPTTTSSELRALATPVGSALAVTPRGSLHPSPLGSFHNTPRGSLHPSPRGSLHPSPLGSQVQLAEAGPSNTSALVLASPPPTVSSLVRAGQNPSREERVNHWMSSQTSV